MAWMERPTPARMPKPRAQSPGTTSSRSCRKLWTAWMVGRYTPAIRRMEEPEIPGSTMAVMATAPERKR